MKLGRKIMNELRKLFNPPPVYLALAPSRVKRKPAQDWVARNRCW